MNTATAKAVNEFDVSRSMGLAKFSVDIPDGHIALIKSGREFEEIETSNSTINFLKTVLFKNVIDIETDEFRVQVTYSCAVVPTRITEKTIHEYPKFNIDDVAQKIHFAASSFAKTLIENGSGWINSLTTELKHDNEIYELRFTFEFDR